MVPEGHLIVDKIKSYSTEMQEMFFEVLRQSLGNGSLPKIIHIWTLGLIYCCLKIKMSTYEENISMLVTFIANADVLEFLLFIWQETLILGGSYSCPQNFLSFLPQWYREEAFYSIDPTAP